MDELVRLHICERLLGILTWDALGLERQHVGTAAGVAQADQEVPEEGVQADPAPALAPQEPPHGCSHPQEHSIEAVEIRGGGGWLFRAATGCKRCNLPEVGLLEVWQYGYQEKDKNKDKTEQNQAKPSTGSERAREYESNGALEFYWANP
ncbi:hypothetical protein Tco_1026160 [Tanacetum coccineum]